MRILGDAPEADKKLAEELTVLEEWFYENGEGLPALAVAKGMVAMSHDYYIIFMDEEGDRLLQLAEKNCPGYFKGPIWTQIEKDVEYYYLVASLMATDGAKMMESLGFRG